MGPEKLKSLTVKRTTIGKTKLLCCQLYKIFHDVEILQDMEIIMDMEVKHHTLYHTSIDRRNKYIIKYIICTLTHFINSC